MAIAPGSERDYPPRFLMLTVQDRLAPYYHPGCERRSVEPYFKCDKNKRICCIGSCSAKPAEEIKLEVKERKVDKDGSKYTRKSPECRFEEYCVAHCFEAPPCARPSGRYDSEPIYPGRPIVADCSHCKHHYALRERRGTF
jgi:hypothetical protein